MLFLGNRNQITLNGGDVRDRTAVLKWLERGVYMFRKVVCFNPASHYLQS